MTWSALAVGLAGALAAGLSGGYRWYLATTHYGPAVVAKWSTPWFIAAGGFGVLALAVSILLFVDRRMEVGLYGGGIVYQRGGRRIAVPWQDIQRLHASAVRYGIFGLIWGGEMEVRLDIRGGNQIRLTRSIANLTDLVEKIKRNIYPHLLAGYTRAFNHGQPLEFGPLTLNDEGIVRGGRILPWSQLASADVERGVLRLNPVKSGAGRRIKLSAHRIPNLDVCLQLIQNLRQRA